MDGAKPKPSPAFAQLATGDPSEPTPGKATDWYFKGQSRIVEIDGMRFIVRLVDRKARRARILIRRFDRDRSTLKDL